MQISNTDKESNGKYTTKQLEAMEKELLNQFKKYDRLHQMAQSVFNPKNQTPKTSPPRRKILQSLPDLIPQNNTTTTTSTDKDYLIDLPDSELVQLQDRILEQQDQQLDGLAQVLQRQKKVFYQIYSSHN